MNKRLSIGLFGWYSFDDIENMLIISSPYEDKGYWDDVKGFMESKNVNVAITNYSAMADYDMEFDCIVSIGGIEETENPTEFINRIYEHLKTDGVAFIGCYNKLGIGTFSDTDRIYDRLINEKRLCGRKYYGISEIKNIIRGSRFQCTECYVPLPGFEKTQILLKEGYIPNEYIEERFDKTVDMGLKSIFCKYDLFTDLLKNDLFYKMSDEYLWKLRKTKKDIIINQITVSADREKSKALVTIIYDDHVVKKALYDESVKQLNVMHQNHKYLRERGIDTVDEIITDDYIEMPYLEGVSLVVYLQELMINDLPKFYTVLDRYRELILSSSEISEKKSEIPTEAIEWINERTQTSGLISDYKSEDLGCILKRGYLDLMPLNIFYHKGKLTVLDQEYTEEDYPANAIFYRGLCCIYAGRDDLFERCNVDDLLARYGLAQTKPLWEWYTYEFLKKVNVSTNYDKEYNFKRSTINKNLQHLRENLPAWDEEYYFNPNDLYRKNVYIWGAGKYAETFFNLYSKQFDIKGVIDNDITLKGKLFHEISIMNGGEIDNDFFAKDTVMVVCVKDYEQIVLQLIQRNICNFKVFRPNER